MRHLIVLPLLVLATAVVPTAAADPECVMMYPWSQLCQGDVEGFLYGMGLRVGVECIAMSPWWELCNGDVVGFVEFFTGPLPPLP